VSEGAHQLGPVLAGTRVLVTAQRRADDLALALVRRGAAVDQAASLGVESHIDEEALLEHTRELIRQPPDVVVVTTGIGFRGWLETAEANDLDEAFVEALRHSRVVARGPKAKGALQAADLAADWVADSETSAEIADFLCAEGVAGQRIFVQHHGAGDDGLEARLRSAGATTTGMIVYRWGAPPDAAAVEASVGAAANGEYDAVVFTSAPGAAAWLDVVDKLGVADSLLQLAQVGRPTMVAVGPVTAEPLVVRGFEPLLPERARLGALVRAMIMKLGVEAPGITTSGGVLRLRATSVTLDHEVLAVSPSGLSLLRALASDPGSVLSRERLLDALPGDSLDPHSVEVAIARLREAVGRNVVGTVVKRGYRIEVAQ
jgi:uroporphyrinogen-III synthase